MISPGKIFGMLTIPLRFGMSNLALLVGMLCYQSRSSVCPTRISLGLLINAGVLHLKQEAHFGGPVISLGLPGKSLSTVKWELMTHSQKLNVSLVSETAIFLQTPSPHGVRLEFVIAPACWWGWWTGVRLGWWGWSAVRSFWQQAVQGFGWSATHFPSVFAFR